MRRHTPLPDVSCCVYQVVPADVQTWVTMLRLAFCGYYKPQITTYLAQSEFDVRRLKVRHVR